MATIAGPVVQMPTVTVIQPQDGPISFDWASFFRALQQIGFNVSRSGPTGSRPTASVPNRFIGMPFFDTTLGFSINLQSVNPDVWVDGTGTPV